MKKTENRTNKGNLGNIDIGVLKGEPRVFANSNLRIWTIFQVTTRMLDTLIKNELKDAGINISQAHVLALLSKLDGNANIGYISKRLFRRPHTTSELLSRMEQKGLCRRVRRNGTGQITISLTKRGRQIVERITNLSSLDIIFADLRTDEIKTLRNTMVKIRDRGLRETGAIIKRESK